MVFTFSYFYLKIVVFITFIKNKNNFFCMDYAQKS